jgi:DNA-binding NtrC family response regulator
VPEADPDRDLRERITGALTRAHGNVTEVARDLGWHRSPVYDELARLGIDAAKFRKR